MHTKQENLNICFHNPFVQLVFKAAFEVTSLDDQMNAYRSDQIKRSNEDFYCQLHKRICLRTNTHIYST